jgi:alpha-tubulin suppressor-like RCC1 family protein
MPKLVSIAVEHKDFYVAVDEDGQVWTGGLKRSSEGGSFYIEWKPLGSKFPKEGDR